MARNSAFRAVKVGSHLALTRQDVSAAGTFLGETEQAILGGTLCKETTISKLLPFFFFNF